MNKLLKNTNANIIERNHAIINVDLRQQLYNLKVGETIVTRDKDAKKLAGSLSRSAKTTSGTRFAVRDLLNGQVEVQLIRHYSRH
jgi:hypothetical protein